MTLEDRRAIPVFLRLLREMPTLGTLVIPALAKLEGRQAIPPLIECLQGTDKAVRIAALRALSSLADAAHAEQIWKAVMAVRETADDAELKEAANATANALVSRGVLVRPSTNSTMVQLAGTARSARPWGLGILTPASHDHDMEAIITDDHETDRYIDADTLESGDMLVERYRVIRRVGKGGLARLSSWKIPWLVRRLFSNS